jgi:hypothetical protein
VAHDPLHHVGRDAVVDEPRSVGVPQVVEPQPAVLMGGDVVDGGGLVRTTSVRLSPSASVHWASQPAARRSTPLSRPAGTSDADGTPRPGAAG